VHHTLQEIIFNLYSSNFKNKKTIKFHDNEYRNTFKKIEQKSSSEMSFLDRIKYTRFDKNTHTHIYIQLNLGIYLLLNTKLQHNY